MTKEHCSEKILRFGKPLGQLTKTDLQRELVGRIQEGMFVEFKRNWPDELSKHFAAFANSHGGYLVIGVETDTDNVASALLGIDYEDGLPDWVMGKVVRHIEPVPIFNTIPVKFEKGKKCIIIVRIEEGDDPPYLTGDGRIYERKPACSDPVDIRDRYKVDLLYKKSETSRRAFQQMMERTYWALTVPREERYGKREQNYPSNRVGRALIVAPKVVRAELLADFFGTETRDFLREVFDRHMETHGGAWHFEQSSMRVGDPPGKDSTTREFTEIHRSGLIENHEQIIKSSDYMITTERILASSPGLLGMAADLYRRHDYYGKVHLCLGISGFYGWVLDPFRRSAKGVKNYAEITREMMVDDIHSQTAQVIEGIREELRRAFGYTWD
jgi:hypothetical protein